ncbi:methyltransferase [Candidatus Woesearchaeota archaeon]|jgi:O-methyltransferase|nr:methyltransferase [Candidatus Woesearchaeota archaeon]MBT6518770.1 methyltransferase [Candidatus Woesearchaeota archaeon]MBT7366880.1 methyltransferase [Candidatus Woesearchaeota archaeon]
MTNLFILDIIENNSMMSIEQEMNIFHLLSRVVLLKIPGAVVELGCHEGLTAAIMQKTLDGLNSNKKIYVYDSFEGLPKLSKKDKKHILKKGDLNTSEKKLIKTFTKLNLKLPKINKYWFKNIPKNKLPKNICFAHLDGDTYYSIKESLEKIYPLLSQGAITIIDDCYDLKKHKVIENKLNSNKWNKNKKRKYVIKDIFPGVKTACDEFFKDKKEKPDVLISGDQCHVYFVKK